jgi:PST family polysaccharide transporter
MTTRAAPGPDSLRQNLLALYLLQAANYGMPMLIVPFLVRAVGIENFGLIAFAQAVIQYFVFAVDSGFNNNATREIAVHSHQPGAVLEIYWATQTIRAVMLLLATVVFVLLLLLVPRFGVHWQLYLLSYLTVLGTFVFSPWLYQGLERMRLMAALQVSGRILAVVALVVLIRESDDYILAAGIQASATLVSGLLGFVICLRSGMLRWQRPTTAAIRRIWHQGRPLFWSEFLGTCVSNSGIFVLGLVASSGVVGAYAAIEKLVRALMSGYLPISQALLPRVAIRLSLASLIRQTRRRLRMLTVGLFAVAVVGASMVSVYASSLLAVIFGPDLAQHGTLLAVLIWVLPLDVVNVAIGQLFVFAAGHRIAYANTLTAAASIQGALLLALVAPMGSYGVAAALLAAQLCMLVMLLHVLFRLRQRPARAVVSQGVAT